MWDLGSNFAAHGHSEHLLIEADVGSIRPTFVGARLTEEDRKSLLGHMNGSITSHYSGAEQGKLIDVANMVSNPDSRGPVLKLLKRKSDDVPKKSPHAEMKKPPEGGLVVLNNGRDGVIRTLDPLHPMQVRYRAALRPDWA